MRLIVRPEAEADLAEAFAWYEHKQGGLGSQFLVVVDAGLASILENPEAYPLVHRRVRRVLVRRFPYAIYFTSDSQRVMVIAVMHARRSPRRWRDRA